MQTARAKRSWQSFARKSPTYPYYNLLAVLGWLNWRNCKLLRKQTETRNTEFSVALLCAPRLREGVVESGRRGRDANISKCLNGAISKSKSDYTEALANVSRPTGDLNSLTNIACNAASFIRRRPPTASIRSEINTVVNVGSIYPTIR